MKDWVTFLWENFLFGEEEGGKCQI